MGQRLIYLLEAVAAGSLGVMNTLNEIAKAGGGCKNSLKVFLASAALSPLLRLLNNLPEKGVEWSAANRRISKLCRKRF